MIPNVTVGPPFNASALPIVTAQSPGCKASELPNEAAFKFAEIQPLPKPEDALNDVYVNYPKNLIL